MASYKEMIHKFATRNRSIHAANSEWKWNDPGPKPKTPEIKSGGYWDMGIDELEEILRHREKSLKDTEYHTYDHGTDSLIEEIEEIEEIIKTKKGRQPPSNKKLANNSFKREVEEITGCKFDEIPVSDDKGMLIGSTILYHWYEGSSNKYYLIGTDPYPERDGEGNEYFEEFLIVKVALPKRT